jgi:cytoskeletal protein RodZ
MMNFERIDDYLANRLPAEERNAFEQEIAGDPALQDEVAFQEKIVSAVRQARAAELKQMLNNVPVSSGWSSGKIAAGVVVAGIVATSVYFYLTPEESVMTPDQDVPEVVTPSETPEVTPATEPEPEPEPTTTPASEEPGKKAESPKRKTVTPVQKPDIQVIDPSADLKETSQPTVEPESTGGTTMTVSKMEVVTAPANKYGPFDSSLYEILEINGGSHAVFLFYKENYYLLDEGQDQVTELAPIRDSQLLQKLKEYRSR